MKVYAGDTICSVEGWGKQRKPWHAEARPGQTLRPPSLLPHAEVAAAALPPGHCQEANAARGLRMLITAQEFNLIILATCSM